MRDKPNYFSELGLQGGIPKWRENFHCQKDADRHKRATAETETGTAGQRNIYEK